jgi:hypothetical protein
MRPYDTYRASLVAGDEDALIVRKVTNNLEISVAASQDQDPFVLTSLTAARQIAEEFQASTPARYLTGLTALFQSLGRKWGESGQTSQSLNPEKKPLAGAFPSG